MLYILTQKKSDCRRAYEMHHKYIVDSIYESKEEALNRLEKLTQKYEWEESCFSGRVIAARRHKHKGVVVNTALFEVKDFGEVGLLVGQSHYVE